PKLRGGDQGDTKYNNLQSTELTHRLTSSHDHFRNIEGFNARKVPFFRTPHWIEFRPSTGHPVDCRSSKMDRAAILLVETEPALGCPKAAANGKGRPDEFGSLGWFTT